ncbi:MAG TPA: 30S ribosomal protein S12 methylthiotransferase RimO, partial [Acidimicrobiales bacterium]|nr:30S ribosomal protein S12 methylthiotransferase RimO [Acidimicrobiales bacterium]
MAERYWLETLGCPKNQVDSDKLVGVLVADGMQAAGRPEEADLVVVNTCAFIEDARQESIDVVLDLAARKGDDARLVVTGCLAER